jgi:hypothetical protein
MPQPEILRLGRRLAREIGEDDDTLRKWMAHHLAELIEAAPNDAAAAEQAVDTILRVWAKRERLPGGAWPLGRYREVIQVLERLSPAAEPWRQLRAHDEAAPLAELFSGLNRLFLLALFVHLPATDRVADREDIGGALEEDETLLVEAFNRLTAFLNQPRHEPDQPRVVVTIVDPNEGQAHESIPDSAPSEPSGEGLSDRYLLELTRELVSELHESLDGVQTLMEQLVARRSSSDDDDEQN